MRPFPELIEPMKNLYFALLMTLLAANPLAAQTWNDLSPATGPEPSTRAWASGVFDAQDNRMIIFGGRAASDKNDIWAFDLDTEMWTDLTPMGTSPAPRRTPGSIYDPVGHRMITWSGQAPGTFFNDVWEFDLTSNTWSLYSPTGGPPNVRYGVALVRDPNTNDLVTFAGFTNMGRFDDVWRFNATANTWTDVSSSPGPIERCLHSACYDEVGHRMIMYGGQNGGALDDVWAFDLNSNTWSEITPTIRPAGRWFPSNVYDAANRRMILYGGFTISGYSDEVWAFDLWTEEFTQVTASGGPGDREAASAIYDGANDRMVVFGGSDGTTYNDVWELTGLSDVVTSVGETPAIGNAVLLQNAPNPFNPTTTIGFDLAQPERVRVDVYSARGQLIRNLLDETRSSGRNTVVWNGRDNAGRTVASGMYLYRLETAGGQVLSRKMLLAK